MESRQIIEERIILDVPTKQERRNLYKPGILWSELAKTPGVLPTDIVFEVGYRKVIGEASFGGWDSDNETVSWRPTLVVVRERPETDEEFINRHRKIKLNEEQERLVYLRLKAKYGND